jgi:hypothetical protein
MGQVRQVVEQYISKYFPRRTGHYAEDVIATMKASASQMNPWLIEVGAEDTTYAGFVNKMRGVNWTNPATVEGAQGLLAMFVRQQVKNYVKQAVLNAANYATYQQQVRILNA